MINISISAIWVAFFGALIGAVLGVALSFFIIKREVKAEIRRIESEYKLFLVQGLVSGVMNFFGKDSETSEDKKTSTETK